ncbi:hypothetical protein [Hymenobacter ruber]
MKSTLLTACLLWCAVSSHRAFSQVYQPKDDCAFLSSKRFFHFVGDAKPLQAEELKDLPLTQRVAPVKPAVAHPIEVAESERAYADGRLADAVEAVAKVAALNPPDPQVLNCYARALYRQEATRNQSYPVYQRLIRLLDSYGQEGPEVVSMYIPFLEAYFKLATLQLDHAQWAAASYNLSRAAAAIQSMQNAAADNRLMREQILQYQTECFSHLHNVPLCRYFGQRTLQSYPNNQYVLSYLPALPKSSHKAPASRR